MAKPVNLMASIQNASKSGTRMSIKIEADDVWFDPEAKGLTAELAEQIKGQIVEHLKRGEAPTGQALPALAKGSLEARRYEAEMAQRGGKPAERFVDPKVIAQAERNFRQQYTAPRLGSFTPHEGKPRGNVSGMLVASILVRPARDGKSMMVYVASKRNKPRPSRTGRPQEKQSALESTFGAVPVWDEQAQNTPEFRKNLEKSAKSLLGKSLRELKSSALDALQRALDVAEDGSEVD